jgi:hypothetical protein
MSVPQWLNTKVLSLLGLLVIASVLYLGYARPIKAQGFKDRVVLDTSDKTMLPYSTEPINSIDQYELEAVFQNEGDRELKQQQINQMTRRYPLDWTNYPPNSSKFQSEQAKYIEGFSSDSSAVDLDKPYEAIGIGNLTPPDTLATEKEERRILSTYAPKRANDLKTYDVDDAQELIERIYQPKGLVPTVVRKDGNVFEVVSTRSLKNTIEYEDDLPDAPWSSMRSVGEAKIDIPAVATETAAGRDPFYEPTTSTRSDRSDYTKWTPGLERMYAPTYPTTDWIGQPTDR